MAFVERLGVSQEDTMEGPLWRETLGRSLGSHDAAELVGVMFMAMVAEKKSPASTLYHAQRRDGTLSSTTECSTRHWIDPFARANFSLLLKTHPFRERASFMRNRAGLSQGNSRVICSNDPCCRGCWSVVSQMLVSPSLRLAFWKQEELSRRAPSLSY